MTVEDFWAKAKVIYDDWFDGDKGSLEFFIGDMEELFNEWDDTKDDDLGGTVRKE